MTEKEYQDKMKIFVCAGDTIQEHIDCIGMSRLELAKKLDVTIYDLNKVIEGETPITEKLSIKLEQVLGVPAKFWIDLDKISKL